MKKHQFGATTVEFALIFVIFIMFLLGITDFARMLYTWGVANEATRFGARFAAICDDTTRQADVLAKMQLRLPQISTIDVAWGPTGCNVNSCQTVTVTITGLTYQWISPIAGVATYAPIPMPTFATTVPREVMQQDPVAAPFACS